MKKRNLLNFNLLLLLVLSSVSFSQTSNFQLQIKVFLEGPYLSDNEMTDVLDPIPTFQPFNQEPWNYEGTEEVIIIPENVVDWVLVELRNKDDNTEVKSTRAGFLLKDGSVVDLNGTNPLEFEIEDDKYYVVVNHRNHMSVMSERTIGPMDKSCPGMPKVYYEGGPNNDDGGDYYNTVQIGDQCWLKENLNIGLRIDGVNNMTDDGNIEKYCYDDIETNCEQYGGLYQWNEAMQYLSTEGAQGICPEDWHLPSKEECEVLQSIANDKVSELVDLSESGNTTIYTPTNETGFSAIFAGNRDRIDGSFDYLGSNVSFRSSTHNFPSAFIIRLFAEYSFILIAPSGNSYGYSVRCIKDDNNNEPPSFQADKFPNHVMSNISIQPTLEWSATDPEDDPLTYDVYLGTTETPELVSQEQSELEFQTTELDVYTTYYWKIIAKDDQGNETESELFSFTTSKGIPCPEVQYVDYGEQRYNTVQIGEQCWLKENLDIGIRIDESNGMTDNGIIEKYCYDDDPANCDTYGGLYQWNEAMHYVNDEGTNGICPDGWHIPKLNDIQILFNYVNNDGNALKNLGQGEGAGTGTNTSGFSILLSGYLDFFPEEYNNMNLFFYGWSSSLESNNLPYFYSVRSIDNITYYNGRSKDAGMSVRCLKNEIVNLTPSFENEIFPNNEMSNISVQPTLEWSATDPESDPLTYDVYLGTTETPELVSSDQSDPNFQTTTQLEAYKTYYWKVVAKDGSGNETESDLFSFTTSKGIPCPDVQYVDYGEKRYNTVQIGDQCWLKENLDIGDRIDGVNDMTDYGTIEKYCYNDIEANCDQYGGLYQWDEAMQYVTTEGAQGICPEGWHVPSNYSFEILEINSNTDGNSLKSVGEGVESGSGTNTTGFSLILGGRRFSTDHYERIDSEGVVWSSSSSTYSKIALQLFDDNSNLDINNENSLDGFSVRCIKD